MMNAKQILANVHSSDVELKRIMEMYTNRMLSQIRQNFAKLNSINKNEIEKIFTLSNISRDDLKDILKEYPGGGYVMNDPLYTLITFIAIRQHIDLDEHAAQISSMLLSLIMLARLKYKYIRICDPSIISLAFSLMSKKTYIGTNGLVWGVYKISNDTFNKYKDLMSKKPMEMYYRYRYIIDIRNKFNQLMKHIAQMYYWTILNKDKIYTKDKIKEMTSQIVEYVSTTDLNEEMLNIISTMSQTDENIVYDFIHQIQINNNFQEQFSLIIFKLCEKMIEIKKYADNQQIDIDYKSLDFLKELYINSRRSSTLLGLARNSLFENAGFSSNLVLAFSTTIIVAWESLGSNITLSQVEQTKERDSEDYSMYNKYHDGLYENFDLGNLSQNVIEERFYSLIGRLEDLN